MAASLRVQIRCLHGQSAQKELSMLPLRTRSFALSLTTYKPVPSRPRLPWFLTSATTTTTTTASSSGWRHPPRGPGTRSYNHGRGGSHDQQDYHEQDYQRRARDSNWITRFARVFVGANAVSFVGFHFFDGHQDVRTFLQNNFSLEPRAVENGRYWTLLTVALHHANLPHLVFNMVTFWTMAQLAAAIPISALAQFGTLVVGSTLAGSLAWIAHEKSRPGQDKHRSACGASGMIYGMMTGIAFLWPGAPLRLFGLVPIRLAVAVPLAVGYDVFLNDSPAVGVSAHLGGAVFGVLWWLAFRRRFGT